MSSNKKKYENLCLLNSERLNMFTGGDKEQEKELFILFLTQAEESINILTQTAINEDVEQWENMCHRLKGSSANLGAEKLSAACLSAEKKLKQNLKENKTILLEKIIIEMNAVKAYAKDTYGI